MDAMELLKIDFPGKTEQRLENLLCMRSSESESLYISLFSMQQNSFKVQKDSFDIQPSKGISSKLSPPACTT